jgi:hypothetical protein
MGEVNPTGPGYVKSETGLPFVIIPACQARASTWRPMIPKDEVVERLAAPSCMAKMLAVRSPIFQSMSRPYALGKAVSGLKPRLSRDALRIMLLSSFPASSAAFYSWAMVALLMNTNTTPSARIKQMRFIVLPFERQHQRRGRQPESACMTRLASLHV